MDKPVLNHNSLDESSLVAPNKSNEAFSTSWIRWPIVLTLALINGTNAFLWVSFAPVTDHVLVFYATNENALNMIALIFPLTTIIFGLFAIWLVDTLGLRFAILTSASVNLSCAILRSISSGNISWPSTMAPLALVILGQCLASLAQPLCMFSPTKLALDWFPDHQRTTANTIGSVGNAVGVLLGSALAPLFVKSPADVPKLNYLCLGIGIFGLISSLCIVRRNEPISPPSAASAAVKQHRIWTANQPRRRISEQFRLFRAHIVTAFKLPSFWMLVVSFGCGLAYFTTLSALFQQMLCTKGYSDEFAGLCGSLMIAAGIVGSAISGPVMDKTGKLIEGVQVCYALAVLGGVGFSVVLWFPNQQASILFFVCWFGGFGFAQYSLVLELAAEATYPVPESFTSGLLIIASQLLSVVFVPVMQAAAPHLNGASQFQPSCGDGASPQDYSLPNMVLTSIMVVIAILQLFCLKVVYKRSKYSQSGPHFILDLAPNTELPISDSLSIQSDENLPTTSGEMSR